MQLPAHVFREYDIRGVADRDLTTDFVRALGLALAKHLAPAAGKAPHLALGRDCRVSSPRLRQALVEGLTAGGAAILDIGVGPTPFLYSAVHGLAVDGGIMITGSHNPGEDNGFKIMKGKGSFYGPQIQALKATIANDEAAPALEPGTVAYVDHADAYVERITRDIRLVRTDLPFVVDAGNGAGGPLALAAMRKLGLAPVPIFCEMDGTFPNHHPDPTMPENLVALVEEVKRAGARVGIAYDGDADRIGAVDEKGNIIWGDKLLILFARALLRERPGATVLGEVKCSQTLYDDIENHGGRAIMWKTGHSLIKTKMKEEGALLAGEMSGHIFFADRYDGYDDALYASLRLLEIMAADPRPLSEMLADVPTTFTTPELRVECPDAIKFEVVRRVREHYEREGFEVADIDGARIQFARGDAPAWGLVRASNTGPVLVLRFEASSEAERDRLRAEVEAVVAAQRASA